MRPNWAGAFGGECEPTIPYPVLCKEGNQDTKFPFSLEEGARGWWAYVRAGRVPGYKIKLEKP